MHTDNFAAAAAAARPSSSTQLLAVAFDRLVLSLPATVADQNRKPIPLSDLLNADAGDYRCVVCLSVCLPTAHNKR